MTRIPLRCAVLSAVAFALTLAGCDNILNAFDPNFDPHGNGSQNPTNVQAVPEGGDVREGRPSVKATFPKAGGWPLTVPIVVEFSESMNEGSIKPTTPAGTDAKVIVRVKGTTTPLTAAYDFVLNSRVLIIRPAALTNTANSSFEVVLLPDGRDVDGLKTTNTAAQVLAEFTADEVPEEKDGRILTVLPRDNTHEQSRESDVIVVFTKPANAATLNPPGQPANLQVRPAGGAAVTGTITTPLTVGTAPDPRVVRFNPTASLPGGQDIEVVVNNAITFGTEGVLDFGGRTPFSRFDTVPFVAPTAVHVGNPTTGFDDKVNRNNLQNLTLAVDTPDSTAAGDVVVARIYGLDRTTQPDDDINFVERTAVAGAGGVQTVTIDFSGQLGSLDNPRFSEGEALFAVQLQRGNQHSGFRHSSSAAAPVFDLTPPTLTTLGPPAVAGTNDLITDQEAVALYGTASEAVGRATLTDGVSTRQLYGSSTDGRFLMPPMSLGRLTAPRDWSLLLTDRAGNMAAAPVLGRFVQRGAIMNVQAGSLTVEAYDDATLQVLAGATVVIDPGVPVVPAAAGRMTAVTDATGRATFSGLASPSYTITVVQTGYHLITLYDSNVAFASLPLRPLTAATGTMQGVITPADVGPGNAIVGNNTFDDPLTLAVVTSAPAGSVIAPTPVRPSRPQLVTAFTGSIEPTGAPHWIMSACVLVDPDTTIVAPPAAPVAGGGTANVSLDPAVATPASLVAGYVKNFTQSVGLDTNNLTGPARVRVTCSLPGFCGQPLLGVGSATASGTATYAINASYDPAMHGLLGGPEVWVVAEVRDTTGNVSRHRVGVQAGFFGATVVDLVPPPPSIPTITAPGAPSTGSPLVTFADRLDRASLAQGLAIGELLATDPAGRRWRVLYEDADGQGGSRSVQFPDLSGLTGLATGAWQVLAEGRLLRSASSAAGNLLLEERRRVEVTFARAAAVAFTVN